MDILTLIVLIIMGLMPIISGIVIVVLMIKYDYDCERRRKEIIQAIRKAYRFCPIMGLSLRNTSTKEFGMDIVTKCLEEIISYRTVDNAMLDTLFETNNVSMESRIAIMKKYVGIQCYAYVDSKSKTLEELYETLKTMIRAIKKHKPPIGTN